jgi:RNA polymerase sigma factor (sigma-70 family)
VSTRSRRRSSRADFDPSALTGTRLVARSDLAALHQQHYDRLVRLASMLLNDTGTSEEVVQDAFVKMFNLKNPPTLDKTPAYLNSAVLNGARSHIRKLVVRRRHLPDRPLPGAAAEVAGIESVHSDDVLAEVQSLPRRQAEVLICRYYLDLSEAEIAETLGISQGSVKTHASRGLAKLAEFLEDSR